MNKLTRSLWLFAPLLVLLALASCGKTAAGTPSPQPLPSATATPFQPSPTPVPLAATVNGTPIPLADFQAEYARFQAAQAEVGTEMATPESAPMWVLNDLIDRMLLAEAAFQRGYQPPDAEALWAQAAAQAGGEEALLDFLGAQGYTREDFLRAYAQSEAAAWMVRQIAQTVPAEAEQVHVRQIFVYNKQEAEKILARLQHGEDFGDLAAAYDPQGRGDLGWFPKGYVTQKAIEEAAFALAPGQVSDVVETPLGYHILRVEAREVRPLSHDALLHLQLQAVENWLQQRRSESTIHILLTPTP